MLLLVSGCAILTPTPYLLKVGSDPPGADVYLKKIGEKRFSAHVPVSGKVWKERTTQTQTEGDPSIWETDFPVWYDGASSVWKTERSTWTKKKRIGVRTSLPPFEAGGTLEPFEGPFYFIGTTPLEYPVTFYERVAGMDIGVAKGKVIKVTQAGVVKVEMQGYKPQEKRVRFEGTQTALLFKLTQEESIIRE